MERIKLKDILKEVRTRLDEEDKRLEKMKDRENKEAHYFPVCIQLIKNCYEKGLETKEFEIIKKEICKNYRKNIFKDLESLDSNSL